MMKLRIERERERERENLGLRLMRKKYRGRGEESLLSNVCKERVRWRFRYWEGLNGREVGRRERERETKHRIHLSLPSYILLHFFESMEKDIEGETEKEN